MLHLFGYASLLFLAVGRAVGFADVQRTLPAHPH
jgi:hypothetical protein